MKLTFREAMQMVTELKIFLDMMNSPDTRWDGVQDWLKCHPRWQAKAKHYTTCTPDEALTDLKSYVEEKTTFPQAIIALAITPQIEAQARNAIEKLQTLYRERANNQTEKETKDVRTRMDNRSNKKRAVRRQTNARAKRANEDRN